MKIEKRKTYPKTDNCDECGVEQETRIMWSFRKENDHDIWWVHHCADCAANMPATSDRVLKPEETAPQIVTGGQEFWRSDIMDLFDLATHYIAEMRSDFLNIRRGEYMQKQGSTSKLLELDVLALIGLVDVLSNCECTNSSGALKSAPAPSHHPFHEKGDTCIDCERLVKGHHHYKVTGL